MDEPMEEEKQSDSPKVEEERKLNASSLLRPGSMVMMTITVADYEAQYWPQLENAIHHLLTMKPGGYIPISYEQMYSCVYKCVCKQFSERLYNDLLQYITDHCDKMCRELDATTQDPLVYIETFNITVKQFIQALGGIVPIFNYMNRFYIESKLKTDLNVELKKIFTTNVAEKHINMLLPLLVEAQSKPFAVPPATMASLVNHLYALKHDFAQLQPDLFARYIPNILPPSSESDLQRHIEETQIMQQQLMSHPEFTRGEEGRVRKRPGEDEYQKVTPLMFLPKHSDS
ncbi:CDK2-associated and cullin domain-containing protein 1 isoform X2 [Lingula anatina]|uniref:CDK2-associated and cullin domain-containing protein 1 isoform X1 n=1 Tax=Lingula anatina TaxID=7574 RepID=A0A1S3GXY1_LINAN|nr:CDK2-associated and cullin domain-containing protein 1 isoform X1 [Lingula anatina]XP_013378609.1 CDK2-associated and cullin domain-containing protein 1 isoform X2 [Lingula anatina]|eukprot:XP_013378608.1 CDK2-associated and cullin domain-containing protein 1 isoform X1 [Lingula anatina]